MKSLKRKSHPGENITDCCAEILVYAKRLDSDGAFKPDHLGHITRIFEDNYDTKFYHWAIQRCNEVTEFIKKLCVCDMDIIPQEDLIAYEYLVQ